MQSFNTDSFYSKKMNRCKKDARGKYKNRRKKSPETDEGGQGDAPIPDAPTQGDAPTWGDAPTRGDAPTQGAAPSGAAPSGAAPSGAAPTGAAPTPADASSVLGEVVAMEERRSEEEDVSIDVEQLEDEDEQPTALGQKKKGSDDRYFVFSPEQEDDLIEWWRSNTFMYDVTSDGSYDKGRKERAMAAKAKEFGCTGEYCFKYFLGNISLWKIL